MTGRAVRRSAALAATALLITAAAASADTARPTGDRVDAGGVVQVGPVGPSAVVELDLDLELACAGFHHIDPGQEAMLTFSGGVAPDGGTAGGASAAFPAPPANWPADFAPCPSAGLDPLGTLEPVRITLGAPPVEGTHRYTLSWDAALEPATADDWRAMPTLVSVSIDLQVVANTPPVLELPAGFSAEGDALGGWVAAWVVDASDAEDPEPPVPVCAPAPGTVLPLGPTDVACSVTDSGGLVTEGSFTVTVVDTTPPVLATNPQATAVMAPGGDASVLTYDLPTANDLVDPSPTVTCEPPPGSLVHDGVTTVTCTATDASGNSTSTTFDVEAAHAPPDAITDGIAWDPPVKGGPAGLVGRAGRTVPVKVRIWSAGGAVEEANDVGLHVAACDADEVLMEVPLHWTGADRWFGMLRTKDLPGPGCYAVSAVVGGAAVGSFELTLTGKVPVAGAARAKGEPDRTPKGGDNARGGGRP